MENSTPVFLYCITSKERPIPFFSLNDYETETKARDAGLLKIESHFSKDSSVELEIRELDSNGSWMVLRENVLTDTLSAQSLGDLKDVMKQFGAISPHCVEAILPFIAAMGVRAQNFNTFKALNQLGNLLRELACESGLTEAEEQERQSIGASMDEGASNPVDRERFKELTEKKGEQTC